MSEEKDYSDWQTSPPWIVFDPDTKSEFVTTETLRYYVANVDGKWFICDRFTDAVVHGTESSTRADSIRKFYKLKNRPIPDGWDVPHPVKGTQHNGIG
jgi:hypothetical protein